MKNKMITIALMLGSFLTAAILVRQRMMKGIRYWYKLTMKNEAILKMMVHWSEEERKGSCVSDKLLHRGYKSVAIYGWGIAGEYLYNRLKTSEIDIRYVVDQNASGKMCPIKICEPEDMKNMETDVVIVTAICDYDNIKESIASRVSCAIISLEDIVYEI